MTNKGKNLETEYFAQEDIAARHKLKEEKSKKSQEQNEEELRKLHHLKCSKCGHDQITKRMGFVDVDQCTNCGAIVLAKDDIEKFVAEERSVLKSLIDFFRP